MQGSPTPAPVADESAPSPEPATGDASTLFGLRRSAIVELLLFLGAAIALDQAAFGNSGFWTVAPHPYWLIVLLISIQYGTSEGLIAALACSVALLAGHLPEQSFDQDIYAYLLDLARRPLMWLVAAVVLGELRVRQLRERARLRADLAASRRRAQSIAEAYEHLDEVKRDLEVRVAGQLRTVVSMYEAAKAVETMEPARVVMGALDNLRAIMNPDKCSMFVLREGELQAGIQNGWGRKDRYKRRFRADNQIFTEVVGRRRVLCVIDPDDEQLLAGQGVLAGAVANPDTGEVYGMLKIEDMGFLDLNLSSIELFRVLCEWVGAFYANAMQYREGQSNRAIDSASQLYAANFYPRQRALLVALARRVGFALCALHVRVEDPYALSRDQRATVAATLAQSVLATLRNTDLAFQRGKSGGEFIVLLPNTPEENTALVVERLHGAFRAALPEELANITIRIEVEDLLGTNTEVEAKPAAENRPTHGSTDRTPRPATEQDRDPA